MWVEILHFFRTKGRRKKAFRGLKGRATWYFISIRKTCLPQMQEQPCKEKTASRHTAWLHSLNK